MSRIPKLLAAVGLLTLLAWGPQGSAAQQTLKISATLTIEKTDDKTKTHDQVAELLKQAKDQKLEANVIRFLDNMVQQLKKVLDVSKALDDSKGTEVAKDFTAPKYRVKPMPKLQAKKTTVKKIAAKELRDRLKAGKDINFDTPMLVTNATALFSDNSTWNAIRQHWTSTRLAGDEELEKSLRLEYWPPDKARARLVGNTVQMEEPEVVPFSRYLVICFHGTPAKPKLPGQNTEHCEQTVEALSMAKNESELQPLSIFPELKNMLPMQAEFRQRLLAAGADELTEIIGKQAKRWMERQGKLSYRYFVFGPSGSGDKLHAENGLPFYDILIHGSRRWLLLTEEEMERVAVKAREALEFDKTSAYMFFEEKLPELIEEFGLKKYQECNQQAGDLLLIPSGWFRVSLALADSISYYETVLSERNTLRAVVDNNVWRPAAQQFRLAFCYDPSQVEKEIPGLSKNKQMSDWLKNALKGVSADEAITGILAVMMQCGAVLSMADAMPKLGVEELSVCTPVVWKNCRSQLEKRLKEKNSKAKLKWLPLEPPTSPNQLPALPSVQAEPPRSSEEL